MCPHLKGTWRQQSYSEVCVGQRCGHSVVQNSKISETAPLLSGNRLNPAWFIFTVEYKEALQRYEGDHTYKSGMTRDEPSEISRCGRVCEGQPIRRIRKSVCLCVCIGIDNLLQNTHKELEEGNRREVRGSESRETSFSRISISHTDNQFETINIVSCTLCLSRRPSEVLKTPDWIL